MLKISYRRYAYLEITKKQQFAQVYICHPRSHNLLPNARTASAYLTAFFAAGVNIKKARKPGYEVAIFDLRSQQRFFLSLNKNKHEVPLNSLG